MLSLLACALLVVVLGLAVLASMLVENWGRWTVDLPLPAAPTVPEEPTAQDVDEPDLDLVITGRACADRAVAALFAAYAACRLPEANRAAAWVTAIDRPPGPLGASYPPGIDLRARPVAAGRLLDCADEGRCWLTLSAGTDIGRGLRARPPSCPVLRGCAVLWHGTRAALTRLTPDDVQVARAAVAELASRWATTTAAPDLAPIADALERAAADGSGLIVRVPLGSLGPVPAPVDAAGVMSAGDLVALSD